MKMNGNAILITGGATGIGYAMAKYFLERGNEVLICGRRQDRLAQAAQEMPGLQTMRYDVTNPVDRMTLFTHVRDFFPEMNILINNAGIQREIDLTKGTTDFVSGESEIQVNLEAPILLSALFTPFLAGKENAAIIHVTSGLAFMPDYAVGMPLYHTTKAGLHAFAVVQRKQLAPLGIRVIELIPPAVESELNMEGRISRNMQKSPHFMPADDFVAKAFAQMEQDVDEIRLER
jgi:uncharacterized oxidoreductase